MYKKMGKWHFSFLFLVEHFKVFRDEDVSENLRMQLQM